MRESNDPIIRKQIKLSLPQATISGVFAPTRSANNLVTHSGLICVTVGENAAVGHLFWLHNFAAISLI